MNLARVAGTVTATVKSDAPGAVYLLIENCDHHGVGNGEYLVALDVVGADRGQLVMFTQGSSCRWHVVTEERPIDALVVGIVDTIDERGHVTYPAAPFSAREHAGGAR